MLTKQQVKQIVKLCRTKTQDEVAKEFSISRSMVSDIVTGRAYPTVTRPDEAAGETIRGLEAEITHLKDELRSERKKSQSNSRIEGLFAAIAKELESKVQQFKPLPDARKRKPTSAVEEHLVVHISDGHHDQVIRPSEVGGLEEYDFRISCSRAEHYVESIIKWSQETLTNFTFPHLTILNYGDSTCGEIHRAVERSYFRNQFDNCLAIGGLYGRMYRDLAPYFESVRVVCLSGNHGRRTQKKDYYGANENWDYLVHKTASLHCGDLKNVQFVIPDAWSANVEINGQWVNVSHGDDVRSNGGVPFYGMQRRQKNLVALSGVADLPRIRYFVMGHHHVSAALADVEGELLINGAWPGTDPFAFNALAGYREPVQLIHGMHHRNGVTWRLPIKLRHDGEKRGPKRYEI